MSIHRYPNTVSPGEAKFCQECHQDNRKGYWLFWQEVYSQAVFVCDDCLATARTQKTFTAPTVIAAAEPRTKGA